MWPDPKDIGLIVVAIIAGCFSCWTAFNSMDSNITAIRVKWLDTIKTSTAEYLASFNSWLMELVELHAVEEELDRVGDFKHLPSMEVEYQSLESKRFGIAQKANKHLYDLRCSQNRIHLELDASDPEFKKILTLMERVRKRVNDLKEQKTIDDNSDEVVKQINKLKWRFAEVYKTKWRIITEGDKKLVRAKRGCVFTIVAFVLVYILYVVLYIIFNDASLLNKLNIIDGNSVLFLEWQSAVNYGDV